MLSDEARFRCQAFRFPRDKHRTRWLGEADACMQEHTHLPLAHQVAEAASLVLADTRAVTPKCHSSRRLCISMPRGYGYACDNLRYAPLQERAPMVSERGEVAASIHGWIGCTTLIALLPATNIYTPYEVGSDSRNCETALSRCVKMCNILVDTSVSIKHRQKPTFLPLVFFDN